MEGVCNRTRPVARTFACFSNPASPRAFALYFAPPPPPPPRSMGFGDPQEVRKWDDFNSSLDNPLFRGKKIGVDIMFYIHLALCRRIGAAEMLHVPPVPVTAIEEVLGSILQLFKGEEGAERNITGMFVFDGKHHATKRREDAKRAAAQQASRDRLEALLATASAADFNDVQKLGMKLGTVREDMVELAVAFLLKNKAEVVGAPFEADSQLAYEEAVGNTVASLTIDSDMFMLGSQKWISQLRLPPHAVDVCAKVGEYVMKAEVRAGVNDGESKADKEYSASAVHAYNKALVEETLSPSRRREKAERHERLFQMMERGYLKKGNLLGIYVADVGNKAVRERLLEEVGSPWLKEEQFPPTLHS